MPAANSVKENLAKVRKKAFYNTGASAGSQHRHYTVIAFPDDADKDPGKGERRYYNQDLHRYHRAASDK